MDKIVKLMDESINKLKRLKLTDMNLHEITSVHEVPYFRKMRVESGFMYNFYDCEKDEYQKEWIFVPDSENRALIIQLVSGSFALTGLITCMDCGTKHNGYCPVCKPGK